MSEVVPTVFVKEKDGRERLINASDFDPALHEKVGEEKEPEFKIKKKDGKFFIVNQDGEQIGEGFDTKEAAQDSLKLMVG